MKIFCEVGVIGEFTSFEQVIKIMVENKVKKKPILCFWYENCIVLRALLVNLAIILARFAYP